MVKDSYLEKYTFETIQCLLKKLKVRDDEEFIFTKIYIWDSAVLINEIESKG